MWPVSDCGPLARSNGTNAWAWGQAGCFMVDISRCSATVLRMLQRVRASAAMGPGPGLIAVEARA